MYGTCKHMLTFITKWSVIGRLSNAITITMTTVRMTTSSTRAVLSDKAHLWELFSVLSFRMLFASEHTFSAMHMFNLEVSIGKSSVADSDVRVSVHLFTTKQSISLAKQICLKAVVCTSN